MLGACLTTYLDLGGTKLRDNGKVAETLRGLITVAGLNGTHWCFDPHLHDERVEHIIEHVTLQEEQKEKVCEYMHVYASCSCTHFSLDKNFVKPSYVHVPLYCRKNL